MNKYLTTSIEKPVSQCCHAQYTVEAWGTSLSRRCKTCNKRCQIMSSDDIVEEEEEEEEEVELPLIEKGIPIVVTLELLSEENIHRALKESRRMQTDFLKRKGLI